MQDTIQVSCPIDGGMDEKTCVLPALYGRYERQVRLEPLRPVVAFNGSRHKCRRGWEEKRRLWHETSNSKCKKEIGRRSTGTPCWHCRPLTLFMANKSRDR